ncbi:protein of unknown function [Loktanella atrilutea]|uniref:DUF305 domain-containing protein n=1 Tax=Loktanella atrilutea TaxID=366533 RepID=A0A1M4SSZ4_LOKAT|nr:DUF305 domain-containing protein [Loktanella atrilutea]SHE35350.1 protein of unknown function [Loktanella atrilutea]
MSTAGNVFAALVIGVVVGVGSMMLLHVGNMGRMDGSMMDHDGMAGMSPMPVTGDPDHDFMAGMVPHHQSAIDMAHTVLETTDDPQVRALAENILATQQAEIDEMNAWLAANPQ